MKAIKVLVLMVLILGLTMAACNRLSTPVPRSVVVVTENPVTCTLLSEPKVIETLTATYSCVTPGSYLLSVDSKAMTAEYFTTDSQEISVTFGPITYPVENVTY